MDEVVLVAELVGTMDDDDDDDDDELLSEDVALLDKELIIEGALISDVVLVEFEMTGKEVVTIVVSEVV